MSVPGQQGRHRAPANFGEEQQFMQMAMAASIQEARDAGIEVSTNLDVPIPPGVRDMQSPFSPFSPASFTSNSNLGTPAGHLGRYNSSFSDPVVFSAHVEPLNALLEDCSRLKELSKGATSFREGCTKLGAVGDEIKLAANNAAQKVGNEDQSLYLSKIFASCHKEVSLATTLIEVYGRYSKVKKYAKVFRKWAIKEKLANAEARLATWLNSIWEFVRDHSTVEFKHKFHELVQMDSVASGAPFPEHRSNPDFTHSHHSTPREGSAVSGLAPLPHHHLSGASALDHLMSSRQSEPVGLFSGDEERRDHADQELDRMFTSAGSRRGFQDLLRTSVSRTEPVTHNPQSTPTSDRDTEYVSGTVWWWSGGYMHVHDIPANYTSSRLPPAEKVSPKSPVKRLALDCNKQFVWAGHENGEVSIWREATSKLACVTSTDLSKDISSVQCIEPLSDLVVAVGCEGGRVLILKLLGQYSEKEHSQMAQILTPTGTAHDDKKQIVKVGQLVALASKGSGAIGVDDVDGAMACVPPVTSKEGPLQLRSVIRGLFGRNSGAPGVGMSSVDKEGLQPPTPSSHADSFTGELAEPGTPLQQPYGSMAFTQTTPALAQQARRDSTSVGGPRTGGGSAPSAGTPFASVAQSVTASGQLSEASVVVVPTPRSSAEPATLSQVPPSQLSAAVSQPSGVVSQPSEDLGGGKERAPRRRFRLDEEEKSTLLRKVTKVGQDLKSLIGVGNAADMDIGGRAHDNRIECMTAVMPYIFTASAANQACDAQIRMWVQSHEKESQQYGLHDTYHCRENRATRCMCVLPWPTDGTQPSADLASGRATNATGSKPWRILTGHDSGNILMFDPSLPHLKPILTIKFPPFVNVHPVDISVFSPLGLLTVTRVDGTVQLMSMITPASRIMKSAIDPLHPNAMDGVVSLEVAGDVLRLHDRRIDHVSASSVCCDMVTGTLRGNVSMWPKRLFLEKASEAGIMDRGSSVDPSGEPSSRHGGEYGDPIFRVTTQKDAIRSSTALDDQDLDIVNAKDIKLHRHLGNGAFGTVREGTLHYTTVAVKILKEGEVMGALGSLAQAGEADRQDIRRGLVREVKILKGIRHPNVLFFRGICVNPPMIITELCEHGSVSDVIQLTVRILQPNSTILLSAEKREQISEHMQWAGRVRLMLDAAKGMLYLHNKDLLHCDLKSLNLLIDKTWTCKVADFGLSRNVSGKQSGKNVPAANNPMWQAPEVIANPSNSSKAGDVYSFGIIMWELLMMQRPWSGTHLSMIQYLVQQGTRPDFPRNLTELPGAQPNHPLPAAEEYIKLMERCWDERVELRPTFEQIVEELEAVEQTAAVHRTKSRQQQKRWQETVRGAWANVQSQQHSSQHQDQMKGGMRSSRLSSMNYSSTSHRGSLPHITSATSSGNLSPLSIGMTPRQAMDLDAGSATQAVDVGAASTSSPHTTPPSNSGEHSMSHSTTQRNDVSDQTDPDTTTTYEGDYTPQERFQRNPGVFTSKEMVPPLVLEPAANGSMRQEGADDEAHKRLLQHGKRRSTDDGAAQDNMLSFDDYLPDGVMGRINGDGLGTLEGSGHLELRHNMENPCGSNASSDDRIVDVTHSRFDASSSEQPVSQVHITIGNSIQERFQEETVSSAAMRSGHPHLDSIPEGHTQTMDTIDAHLGADGFETQGGDTLEMLVQRERYTIALNSSEGEVAGVVRVSSHHPAAPVHPLGLSSLGEVNNQVLDGMYRVSMDHSAIENLPVLDSRRSDHEAHTSHGGPRRIFDPSLQSAAEQGGTDMDTGANSVRHSAGFTGGSPVASSASGVEPRIGTADGVSLASPRGDAPGNDYPPGRTSIDHGQGDALSARFDLLSDPHAVAMASPFVPQLPVGTTSSTALSTEFSPTLPPLSSAFHSGTDPGGLQRGASSPQDQGTPIAAGVWSPFDVEPIAPSQVRPYTASAAGAHTNGTKGAFPSPEAREQNAAHDPKFGIRSPREQNFYTPPEHPELDPPALDIRHSPSLKVEDEQFPISAVQASPFDKEPSAPSVALHSGSVSQRVAQDNCETAPFFRPDPGSSAAPQASERHTYQSAGSRSNSRRSESSARNGSPAQVQLPQPPQPLNEATAGPSRIPSGRYTSVNAQSQSTANTASVASQVQPSPRYTPEDTQASPRRSPRPNGNHLPLAAIAAAATRQMSAERKHSADAGPASPISITSHRLQVLPPASSLGSYDAAASRTASLDQSVFDQDPAIAPQISLYNSPFLKEPTHSDRSNAGSDRPSDWYNGSRSHKGRSSQERHRHRSTTTSSDNRQGRSATTSTQHSHHRHHTPSSPASTPGAHQSHSSTFHDAIVPRLAGAFDGPEPASAQASQSTHGASSRPHFAPPAAHAMAPVLLGAFDVEPPSASMSNTASGPAPADAAAVAVAPIWAGAFDAEPERARGPDVTFELRAVPDADGVTGSAMVPVLPSTFDKEPSVASASGRARPDSDAVAPNLLSLFDQEPAAARSSGGGWPVGVYIPEDYPANSSGHAGAAAAAASSAALSSPAAGHMHTPTTAQSRPPSQHHNGNAHRDSASHSHPTQPQQHRSSHGASSNGFVSHPGDSKRHYAAEYGLAPPPQPHFPDDRLSAFDVEPLSTSAANRSSSLHHSPPPVHPGATPAFRSNMLSTSSQHDSHHSSANGSCPGQGSLPHHRRSPSTQSNGGALDLPLNESGIEYQSLQAHLAIEPQSLQARPGHRRTASASSRQGASDSGRDWYNRPHERSSAGTPPLPPDAFSELRIQSSSKPAQSTPGSSRNVTPNTSMFAPYGVDPETGAATVYSRSHHQSPFFSGNSLSPEELMAIRADYGDPRSSRSDHSTPSFCDPSTPYSRDRQAIAREMAEHEQAAAARAADVALAATGRQLSPVAVTTLQVTPHIRLRTVESNASSVSSQMQPNSSRPPNATTRPGRRLSSQPGSVRAPPNATTRPRRALSQTASSHSHSDRGTPGYSARYSLHSPSVGRDTFLHRSPTGSPQHPNSASFGGAMGSMPRSLQHVPEAGYIGDPFRSRPLSEGGSRASMERQPSRSRASMDHQPPRSRASMEAHAAAAADVWRAHHHHSVPTAAPTGYSPVYRSGAVNHSGAEDQTWFESWRGSHGGTERDS